jgi:FkbM family methyltransferase
LGHGWKAERLDGEHILMRNGTDTTVKCRLNKGTDISLLEQIFISKVYGNDFRGKTVLDVGAYNGDSSIHFARRGAGFVIGLEPDPQNYELAVENLKLNKLEDRVKMFNLALSTRPGESLLAVNKATPNISRLGEKSSKDSAILRVATTSIREIIDYLGYLGFPRIDFLKMNCEGCEYGIISNMPSEILESMEDIILEFHNGPRDMPQILSKHGFKTMITGVTFGYITARRITQDNNRSQIRIRAQRTGGERELVNA